MMTMSSVAQQQEQQVPLGKSGRHQLDTDSSSSSTNTDGVSHNSGRAPAGKQLSVVLPGQAPAGPQKSLVTPTIVTTASSPTHLFGSLAVQLSGQEAGLFTGLPSCTPTSADGLAAAAANLTGINPFFWGVGPNHQAPGGLQVDGEEGGAEQQPASEPGNPDGQRRQLSKLQLDQLQQSAMILSPLSFLLSPEQEAWLRLGQQQQQQQPHPLAATGAAERRAQEAASQQHRLTAQDLTNHQAAATYARARATGAYNPQISSSSSSSNSNQPPRCNTSSQPQRLQPPAPELAPQHASGPPAAHHQNHFSQQPTVLVMSGKGPIGGDFCHHQPAPPGPADPNPAGQPAPMIATIHYDGLHYDPHLQQLYLAQQQHQQQDIYHHQGYPQMASTATPPAATTTYQAQTYATTRDAPMTLPASMVETMRPEQGDAPVIVMEASSSSPPHHHQFNSTSASNSSARSSVSRDTTINVEVLAQNVSPTAKVSQQEAATGSPEANRLTDPLAAEVVVKKKSKGGRKKKQVTNEELMARKNRSKERNRVAAKRCRQKRKQFLDELRDRIDNLSDSNKRVLKENTMLKSELELLRKHHKTCRIISQ